MRAHEFITEATYFGDQCTKDCSGHRAGREWAMRKGVSSPNQMPFGNSNSFYQGGVTYTKEKTALNQKLKSRRAAANPQATATSKLSNPLKPAQ